MAKRILDIRRFHYALASAEHGSFRRAAASLNVQQSTVSRGVRSLEHSVGAELFERGHAGIRPTSAGDLFLEEATLGFDHLERAMQRARALQRCEFGELSIGLSVPLALLGDAFAQFRREHVGVSVEIVEGTSGASSNLIKQRKLDVAFVANRPVDEALRSLHLRDARMFVVLPNTHSLAGAREVVLDELRHERIILSSGGLGPDIADHLARRTANSDVEPNIQLHDVGQFNLVNMVAREFGVARIIETDWADVSIEDVLDTGLFDLDRAQENPLWFKELNGFTDHVPETEEYGIRSFVYRAKRPFNPLLLAKFVNKSWPGVVRSKGFFWLATRPDMVGELSQAGALVRTVRRGRWWASVPEAQWPNNEEWRTSMTPYLDPVWGDRRQELVFIGMDPMDEAAMRRELDACLVPARQFTSDAWARLPDPFPNWQAA